VELSLACRVDNKAYQVHTSLVHLTIVGDRRFKFLFPSNDGLSIRDIVWYATDLP
jgi:hypothetical protein